MPETKCCKECGRQLPKPREVQVEVELLFRSTTTVTVTASSPAEAERLAKPLAEEKAKSIYNDVEQFGIEEYDVDSCTADPDDFIDTVIKTPKKRGG